MSLKFAIKAMCPPAIWALGRRAKKSLLAFGPARNAWFALRDLADRAGGKSDPLFPPRALQFAVGWSFHEAGAAAVRQLVDLAELQPNDRVLEVGSGCGRVAVPLTKFLGEKATYDGFDIMADCVAWCQKAITPRFPNFRFVPADVHNRLYNPRGSTPIERYRFPYADGAFDVVFLTSVFTHLVPEACDRYLGEVARVMRRGGRCMATFFLMNAYSQGLVEQGRGEFRFAAQPGGFWTTNVKVPEVAVALPEAWVYERLAMHGLSIERTEYGSWCGRGEVNSGQDVLVLRKWR